MQTRIPYKMSVVLKWLIESKTLLLFSMGVAIATIVLSLFLFQNIGFHHGGETITANSPHLPTSPFESDPVTSTVSELDWGAAVFAAPEKMQVRSVKTVSLDLSPSQSQAFLDLELRSRLLEEYPEYQVVAATVEVSPRMQAKLEGFGFDVTNTSPEIQAVFQDTTTTWTWQIRPKQTGTLELFVSLNALVSVMEENTPYVVESYNKEVTVTVTVGQQIIYFAKNNWQWLWAVIVGPLLLLGWRNINKTRQQKYESKTSRIWTPDKRDSD